MNIQEIELGFRKHDPRLTALNIEISLALQELPLDAEQSKNRKGDPGDTLCFYLRKPKLALLANQFFSKRGFLQFRFYLDQTERLGITEPVKFFLSTTIGFEPPDSSPQPFTDKQMAVCVYPEDCDRLKNALPNLLNILRPVVK